MRFPRGEAVTRIRAPLTTDRYGNEVRDWPNATRTDFARCAVAQGSRGSSAELLTIERDAVISDVAVYLPPDADVLATDRLEIRGGTYEVVGAPFAWRNPWSGRDFGLVANGNRVEG